jgi:hypothetical protein
MKKTNSNELFPKMEMINLMKSHNFKLTDSSLIENFYYEEPYNPFDVNYVSELYFNNNLLISIKKNDGKFIISIGKDTGWTGGLETSNKEYSFDISSLSFEDFKNGFINCIKNQEYYLISKYGTGNIDEILFKGNIDDIKFFAQKKGYEIKNYDRKLFNFYFCNSNIPTYKNNRVLEIYVLSSIQFNNIIKKCG